MTYDHLRLVFFLIACLCFLHFFLTGSDRNSILVYDIETIREDKNVHKIVLIGFYDYKNGKYGYDVYPNFSNFQRLVKKRKQIVGFNSKAFDDEICKLHKIGVATTFDIFERVKLAVKHQTDHGVRSGYSLDVLSQLNLGEGKLKETPGSVEEAWFKGDVNRIAKYCLQDVKLTKGLFDTRKNIKDPNGKKRLNLVKIMAEV